ncbi:MAG TPA: FtsX-like permease family protein, partial [Actinomycetes bacterium]|nr:FtsX-like permease family protein [Actinomycetes bacterium]
MARPGDRLARWWAGWRVALRMTRRDVRRHKGRAALVVLLVGLPVLLISAGATLLATDSVEPAEEIPARMGQTQASIAYRPYLFDEAEAADGQAAHHEQALADLPRLVDGTLIPTTMGDSRVVMGERKVAVTILGVDGRNPVTAGMVSLTSGRWPAADDEVLVTPLALAKGIPASGTLTLTTPEGPARTVTVVGQGSAGGHFQRALITLPTISGDNEVSYLVDRADPVTWRDVKALNAAGYDVTSRAVMLDPSEAKADPEYDGRFDNGNSAEVVGLVALIAVGMVLETALLAGPAFAVGAARSRRALALAAANGADKRQLRRHVLGQALLLGGLAAVVGATLGPLAARVGIGLWTRTHPEHNLAAVFDVPLGQVLAIVVCAVLASLAAAFAPAVGAARLDLVAILRGHRAHRPAHRGMPVLGLVIATVGGAVVVNAIVNRGREMSVAGGAVLLVGGTLLLIPMLLSLVGRWGARLPLPLRMAARDIGRQRGRAVPTVGAIMAAVATLTTLAIGGISDEAQGARDYQPQAPIGHGLLQGNPVDLADARAVVADIDPELSIVDIRALVPDRSVIDPTTGREGIIAVLPPGCSDRDALDWTSACSLDEQVPP